MIYERLSLSHGGGIVPESVKSNQYTGSAALVIGIGGAGIDAISELKSKICQQLIPDNPGEPNSRYDGIQLLAIDSDMENFRRSRENFRLCDQDFIYLRDNGLLRAPYVAAEHIRNDPLYNWMDTNHIFPMVAPEGAGGVRQIGRYLLMRNANTVISRIRQKAHTAMVARQTNTLDIYIYAGLSGGTGSGCFIDVCYLLRYLIEIENWDAQIAGYFFLPDVLACKPSIRANANAVRYNNSNGYAALKELDYLMSLREANDWFEQRYGPNLYVRSQEPPVDMCHLISASDPNGALIQDGYRYCVNLIADSVLDHLTSTQVGGNGNGITFRARMANARGGADMLHRHCGANRSYHFLGACSAEIPVTEINTYLASGFFRGFNQVFAEKKRLAEPEKETKALMEQLGLTAEGVFREIVSGVPALEMCDIDKSHLRKMGIMPRGKMPEPWVICGDDWFIRASASMQANHVRLTEPLTDYNIQSVSQGSLIARLFRRLYAMAMDPNYGPYYVAEILRNGCYDLHACLEGQIRVADEKREQQILYHRSMDEDGIAVSEMFIRRPIFKRYYDQYKEWAIHWHIIKNSVNECAVVTKTLRVFREQVRELYEDFFRPLCQVLDALTVTFDNNERLLAIPDAVHNPRNTWQILTLNDLRDKLDGAVSANTTDQTVGTFIRYMMDHHDAWKLDDQDKIALLIQSYMLDLFGEESSKSLQDYLFEMYNIPVNNNFLLAQRIESDIMGRAYAQAEPRFWCDYAFNVNTNTFTHSCVSAPSASVAVCDGVNSFANLHGQISVRMTGRSDRIFVQRYCSGVPLYAYAGIRMLKECYDAFAPTPFGSVSHLYANTGRGYDGSGLKDWRNYLPDPIPYSRFADSMPKCEPVRELYDRAVEAGIIGPCPEAFGYVIFTTPNVSLPAYDVSDFSHGGIFDADAFRNALDRLTEMKKRLYDDAERRYCPLLDNGHANYAESVRLDNFIRMPVLHGIVRQELEKRQKIDEACQKLTAILDAEKQYVDDMKDFCTLLIMKRISCKDALGLDEYENPCFIYFSYADEVGLLKMDYLFTRHNRLVNPKYSFLHAFLAFRNQKFDCDRENGKQIRIAIEECLVEPLSCENAVIATKLLKVANEGRRKHSGNDFYVTPELDSEMIMKFYHNFINAIYTCAGDPSFWLTEEELNSV